MEMILQARAGDARYIPKLVVGEVATMIPYSLLFVDRSRYASAILKEALRRTHVQININCCRTVHLHFEQEYALFTEYLNLVHTIAVREWEKKGEGSKRLTNHSFLNEK
jgi:hypothetical protein